MKQENNGFTETQKQTLELINEQILEETKLLLRFEDRYYDSSSEEKQNKLLMLSNVRVKLSSIKEVRQEMRNQFKQLNKAGK